MTCFVQTVSVEHSTAAFFQAHWCLNIKIWTAYAVDATICENHF